MAIKELPKIDDKLNQIYENQVTTNISKTQNEWVDKSDLLLNQMTFIAMNNKNFLNLK